jgi:hypothetical protein
VTFFNPQGSEGWVTPQRNVAIPLRTGLITLAFSSSIPHTFHFSFFLVLQWREGKISLLFILETVGPCAGFPSRLC